jgi:hypothetical protein
MLAIAPSASLYRPCPIADNVFWPEATLPFLEQVLESRKDLLYDFSHIRSRETHWETHIRTGFP